MIERINLIEKEPFKFTYKRVVQVVFSLILLCGVIFGMQTLWYQKQQKLIVSLQNEILFLEEKRKLQLREAPVKIETGPHSELRTIFTSTPRWTSVIQDIGTKIPSSVWLKSMMASTGRKRQMPEADKKKQDKDKNEVPQISKEGDVVLNGTARDTAGMARFVQDLKESPFITNASVRSSEKKVHGYDFVLECSMSLTYQPVP